MDWPGFLGPQPHGLGPRDFHSCHFCNEVAQLFPNKSSSPRFSRFFHLSPWFSNSNCGSAPSHSISHIDPLPLLQILNPIHQSPWNFPRKPLEPFKSKFSPRNFLPPYLFNHNSESGCSYGTIHGITSSSFSRFAYSYDCCICMIVYLSVREFISKPTYEDFKTNYKSIS
jgi:hypothetical protein